MKTRKLTLISSVMLALLVVGAVVLISSSGQDPLVPDQVKLVPKHIDMENTGIFQVQIKLSDAAGNVVVEEIDPSTVLLDGMVAPANTWVEYLPNGKPKNFIAEFDGGAVKGLIWYLIGHMGLTMPNPWNPLPIRLAITGQLYDGTSWEGSGIVLIENWAGGSPPVNPPPP
jgi:hypothetical protein